MRLWSADKSTLVATSVSTAENEWITITPAGYYVASPKWDSLLNVRIGNDVDGIDQWRSSYDRPALVEAALRSEEPEQSTVAALQSPALSQPDSEPILPPVLRIESPRDGEALGTTLTQLTLHLEDRQRAIQSVSLAINGRRLRSGRPGNEPNLAIPLGQTVLDLEVPIQLERGDNLVEVVATNGVAETHRQLQLSTRVSAPPDSLPELWILAIGINEYTHRRWLQPLHYASDDAEAIVDFYKQQEGRLFSKVHTMIITDRAELKPTREQTLGSGLP